MAEPGRRGLDLTRHLRQLLEEQGPPPGTPFPCPYLPGRSARHVTLVPTPLLPGLYLSLMDLNFRRSGPVFYRPDCVGCSACRMLRIPAAEFVPSRAQKRCAIRNRDIEVRVQIPTPSEKKRLLFERYLRARHDGSMDASKDGFEEYLYRSPIESVEIEYRCEGQLIGVGIADVEPRALSAVYCFFDPEEERRSPGVLNVLTLLEECRRRRLPYLYLGYWVEGSRTMHYKADYRPCELLRPDGSWERRPVSRSAPRSPGSPPGASKRQRS
jgi:arginyl-tRNA--protein-N-Asp/Glu arginylyltransferase